MLAKSAFTGVASYSDIQIQKKVSRILITLSGTTKFDTEKITVSLMVNGNQKKVLPEMKVRDAAILSQFRNGFLSTSIAAGGVYTQEFLIELTNDGSAIDLKDNTYLSVNLTGLLAANTYAVYGIEAPVAAKSYLETSISSIAGTESQSKMFTVSPGGQYLGIRNNGGLSLVRFFFNNGEEVAYVPAELRALTREINDITEAADSLVEGDTLNQIMLSGAQEMFYHPISSVQRFEITTVGGTDAVIFITEERTF